MELRLEDLQTEEMHTVDAAGATLGRDSRRASITIPDPGVSGAHARIFSRSGRYYIEDTNSSNGTFVEGNRLRGELELKDGIVISLHKYKFRVSVEVNGANDATSLYDQKGGVKTTPQGDAAPRSMQQARTVMHDEPEDAQLEGEENQLLSEGSSIHHNMQNDDSEPAPRRRDASSSRRRDHGSSRRDSGSLDEGSARASSSRRREVSVDDDFAEPSRERSSMGPGLAGDVKGGFGKALAYYMGAVPKLAFNPVGSTQKLVAEQPFAEMEKLELAMWAAPPLLLGAVISVVASIILGLVTHTFGIGSIISPIISGAITVVVGSIVGGWVWHPLFTWWIRLLKGESNPRGRTNMFIATYTGIALLQVVTGVSVLFALLSVIPIVGPFMQIVPLVLSLFASLISIYIMYVWYGHFRVMDIVPKIIMVLGVLLVASSAWGAIGVVRASIASAQAMAAAHKAEADVAAAQAEAEKLTKQAEAAANGTTAQADAKPTTVSATAKEPATTKDPDRPVATATRPTSAPAVTTSPTPTTRTAESGRTEAANDETPAAQPRPSASRSGRPTMPQLNEHIDAIEKAVTADPSLLAREEGALDLYKKLHATQSKYKVKSKDPVAERIRQAELYAALVDTVEELYSKVAR